MKKAIAIALALVLALTLAACGSSSNGGDTATPPANSSTTTPASQGETTAPSDNGGGPVAWPSFDWVEDWMKKADVGTIVEIDSNTDNSIIYVTFENVSKDGYEAYVTYMAEKGDHRLDEEDSDIIQCTGINVSQISMGYEPFGEKERMDVTFYK